MAQVGLRLRLVVDPTDYTPEYKWYGKDGGTAPQVLCVQRSQISAWRVQLENGTAEGESRLVKFPRNLHEAMTTMPRPVNSDLDAGLSLAAPQQSARPFEQPHQMQSVDAPAPRPVPHRSQCGHCKRDSPCSPMVSARRSVASPEELHNRARRCSRAVAALLLTEAGERRELAEAEKASAAGLATAGYVLQARGFTVWESRSRREVAREGLAELAGARSQCVASADLLCHEASERRGRVQEEHRAFGDLLQMERSENLELWIDALDPADLPSSLGSLPPSPAPSCPDADLRPPASPVCPAAFPEQVPVARAAECAASQLLAHSPYGSAPAKNSVDYDVSPTFARAPVRKRGRVHRACVAFCEALSKCSRAVRRPFGGCLPARRHATG
eukprot:TRINITY_DN21010_c0_g1_i1.p1 TRINITY_DN21010_c0_g1~~TRINITY_DN21010_c0_g1_i1.p1  ORF type:complete len:387 (+),score=63.91 TRINITY_DN21010_c0_g1_i1:84-1244(+)